MKATDFQISSNNLTIEDKAEIKKEKPIYTRSRHSSDLTSFSYTLSETLSQTSENVFIPCELKTSQNFNKSNQKESMNDYFSGIENYYRKTEPNKFYEYKYTKNYLPKVKKEKNEFTQYEKPKKENNNINSINIPFQNISNNKYDNNMNDGLFQFAQNYYQNLFNGNIIYNIFNNFYLNYPFAFSKAQNDTKDKDKDNTLDNKNIKSTENTPKENKSPIKEKEAPEENKEKKNDIEIIYVNKKERLSRHNFNEEKKIDKEYYEPRYSNNNYRGKRDTYINGYKRKNIFYEYNNKFNGNFNYEKSRKKFYGENNFYKRKFFQQNYY